MNHQQEIHQFNEPHFREVDVSQHIVMMVVGNNIVCIGLYSAVNELVVVWVCGDEVEVVMGCKKLGVGILYNSFDNSLGKLRIEELPQDFVIFHENLVGDAKVVLPRQNRCPHSAINAMMTNALNDAISVKYYAHNELNGKFFLCLLLAEPLMKIHFVNLVKAFLVKFTRLPHLFCQFVKLLGIVIAHELLDVIQLFIALDARKDIKQIKLCGIENSWLYTFHNFYAINSRCKDTNKRAKKQIIKNKSLIIELNWCESRLLETIPRFIESED